MQIKLSTNTLPTEPGMSSARSPTTIDGVDCGIVCDVDICTVELGIDGVTVINVAIAEVGRGGVNVDGATAGLEGGGTGMDGDIVELEGGGDNVDGATAGLEGDGDGMHGAIVELKGGDARMDGATAGLERGGAGMDGVIMELEGSGARMDEATTGLERGGAGMDGVIVELKEGGARIDEATAGLERGGASMDGTIVAPERFCKANSSSYSSIAFKTRKKNYISFISMFSMTNHFLSYPISTIIIQNAI